MIHRFYGLIGSVLLFWSLSNSLKAQFHSEEIDYEASITIHPPVDTSRAASVDLFNNVLRPTGILSKTRQNYLQGLPPTALNAAGPFNLVFRDVTNNTGIGFDDPSPTTCPGATNMGEARRKTACAVFNYIASVLDIHPNANPIIVFDVSLTTGTGPLGTGSPVLPVFPLAPNYVGGYLRDHIIDGTDPSLLDDDAIITINFGPRFNNGVQVPQHDCETCMPTNLGDALDLYSILLHEATHALGFFSLITANGTSQLNPTGTANMGPWSLMDTHLQEITPPTFLIDATNTFVAALTGSLTNNSVIYAGPGNSAPQPVYSPVAFSPGSSLSHFDHNRPPNLPYVMRPSTSGGVDRRWVQQELEVLVDLGYSLASPLLSANRPPVGNPDMATTTTGTQVCVDVIQNDTDADGDPISFYADCGKDCQQTGGPAVQLILGGGPGSNLTVNGTQICYTPPPSFVGQAIIKYCPTDGNTSDVFANLNNCTYLTINVPASVCPNDPCNLVCNGSFEEGQDPCNFNFNWNAQTWNQSSINNWATVAPTPDYFSDDPCAINSGNPNPSFHIPLNNRNYNTPPGVPLYSPTNTNGSPNHRYAGFFCHNIPQGQPEGLYTQLAQPLVPGQQYRFECWVFGYEYHPNTSHPFSYVYAGLNIGPPGNPAVGTNHTSDFDIFTTPHPVFMHPHNLQGTLPGWSFISGIFTPTQPYDHLILEGGIIQNGGPTFQSYVYIDDVIIREIEDPAVVTKTVVGNTQVSIGDIVDYQVEICNPASNQNTLPLLTIEDLLPPDVTYVSGDLTATPPHTATTPNFLPPGNCHVFNYQVEVNAGATLNSPITNCVNITNGASNCLSINTNNNCASIEVIGTDISLSKSVVSQTTQPYLNGDVVDFEIQICNAGPADANNILATELLPSGLTYLSHFFSPSNVATYNTSSGQIEIPALANGNCVEMIIRAEVNSSNCSRIDNCVNLDFVQEEEIDFSNNSACAGIDIANPTAPTIPLLLDITKNGEGTAITRDGNGNFYLAGHFSPTITFPGWPTFTSVNGADIFIARYNQNCGFEWVLTYGSNHSDKAEDILVDQNGNIIVTGSFGGSINFGGFTLSNPTPDPEMFLLKISPNGVVLDAVQSEALSGPTPYRNKGLYLSMNPANGNILVSGSFNGTVGFSGSSVTSNGGTDIFIASYSNTTPCTLNWVTSAGSPSNDAAGGLDILSNGARFYAGMSYRNAFSFAGNNFSIGGNADIALLSWDNSNTPPTPAGGHQIGGPNTDIILDLDVENTNIYATGHFSGTLTTGLSATYTSQGSSDGWIGMFDGSLSTNLWSHQFGEMNADRGTAVQARPNGEVWFAGEFKLDANFPGFTPASLASSGIFAGFYGRIGPGNSPDFVIKADGNSPLADHLTPNDMVFDAGGNCYTTGRVSGTATFGSSGTISDPNPGFNAFLARINPTGNFFRTIGTTPGASREVPDFQLFPNPSQGIANLEISNPPNTAWELEVMDLNGRIIQHHTLPASNSHAIRLDLRHVPQSVYFLRLQGSDGTHHSLKLVLQ